MAEVQIDWSTADVHEARLRVTLREAPAASWRRRFRAVLARLQHSGKPWGEVTIKKDRIVVGGLVEGCEDDLRHFLESVALEANAQETPDATESDDDERVDGPDERMTTAFHAFATQDEEQTAARGSQPAP